MACQSNDFLSSYSSVKGKILFLLIFNFYSFPADFLFLNIFFFPSDSFSSTLLLRFLRFSLAPNRDSSAVIGLCNSQFWQHSQPSCLFAAVYQQVMEFQRAELPSLFLLLRPFQPRQKPQSLSKSGKQCFPPNRTSISSCSKPVSGFGREEMAEVGKCGSAKIDKSAGNHNLKKILLTIK